MVQVAKGRILALDVGERYVGVAYSDEDQVMAFPDQRLDRAAVDFWTRLLAKCQELQAKSIVVGWPLTLRGQAEQQADLVGQFQEQLAAQLATHLPNPLPIVRWDERLSSREARDLAKSHSTSSAKSKTDEDSLAAYLILNAYLAALPISPHPASE